MVTISTFGIMISFAVMSPNLIALVAIDSASLSIIFWSSASFKKSVTSDTDCVFIKKGFLKNFFSLAIMPDGGWLSSPFNFSFIYLYGLFIFNFSKRIISLFSIISAVSSFS